MRSMTGFGRASFEVEGIVFDVEIRSVNHRHLDVRARLPKALADLEAGLKSRVGATLQRGKVDVSVSLAAGSGAPAVEVDREAVAQLVKVARELAAEHGLDASLRVVDLLGLPGVARTVERELDPDDLRRAFDGAFAGALAAVDEMRVLEGRALERDIRGRLALVAELLEGVRERAGSVQEAVREKLRKRAEKLELDTGLLDEARLHQEIVIAADRLDVTEEVVRLASHIEQFEAVLDSAGPGVAVGRRLDFLLQEMVRETNTIGSKGSDSDVAHKVVDLKTELERIREQVQNVE